MKYPKRVVLFFHCFQLPGSPNLAMRYYTNNLCWIKDTYYIPFSERAPIKDDEIKTEINYYQWVPLMLILQALLFYMPHMVRSLAKYLTVQTYQFSLVRLRLSNSVFTSHCERSWKSQLPGFLKGCLLLLNSFYKGE